MTGVMIASFGILGIFARYGIDLFAARLSFSFPIGTFLINLLGSALAGLIYVLGAENSLIPLHLRIGLVVGFCGGFTTFSAYMLQSFLLIEQKKFGMALFYACGSPALGVLSTAIGVYLARSWVGR